MAASLSSSSTLASFAVLAALAGCSGEVFVASAHGTGGAATIPSSTGSSTSVGATSTSTSVGGGTTTATSTSTTSTSTTSTATAPPPCDPAKIDQDPNHCGACGHTCLEGDCIAGACQPVLLRAESGSPQDLCLYLDDVYWLNSDGTIKRVHKHDGSQATLAAGASGAARIAVNGGMAYWSRYMAPSSADSVSVNGGPVIGVGYVGPGGGALALDDDYVYWSLFDVASKQVLMKTPRQGGPMTPVSPALTRFGQVTADAGYLYWIDPTSTVETPVPTDVGGIRRAKANVGPIETVITSHDVASIAFDQDYVYWVYAGTYAANWTGGSIRRAPKAGGPVESIIDLTTHANRIAVDDTHVYWVSYDGHAVNRADKHGGPSIKMADAGNPISIAVDDEAVYWVDPTLAEVRKVAK